jgi:hypothetical protein
VFLDGGALWKTPVGEESPLASIGDVPGTWVRRCSLTV